MHFIKAHFGIIICCVLFLCLCLLRLNNRSILTPDSTQYVIWGNSIAHGQGFIDTTQPLPDKFVNHGPLYPLLIAPIEVLFPLSLIAVKAETGIFGSAALLFFYLLLTRFFTKSQALIGTIIFASNPLLLIYSTEALSDIPFITFTLASLFLFISHTANGFDRSLKTILFLAVTVSVPLLREIGVSLIIVYCIFYAINKQWKQAAILAIVTLVVLGTWNIRNNILVEKTPFSQSGNMPWIFEHVMTSRETSFFIEIPVRMWENFKSYAGYLSGMMLFPTYCMHQLASLFSETSKMYQLTDRIISFGKYALYALTIGSFTLGVFRLIPYSKLRASISVKAIIPLFLLCYLGILFLFPFHDIRYMIPLVPFFIYFGIKGIELFGEKLKQSGILHTRIVLLVLFTLLIIPNGIGISEIIANNYKQNKSPILPWDRLGNWIAAHTSNNAIFASPIKDLALVLTEERKVVDMYPTIETPAFEFLLRSYRVEYLLSPTWYESSTVFDYQENASTRINLEHCFSAGGLHLFKVHSKLKEPGFIRNAPPTEATTSELVRAAQLHMLAERYDSASLILEKAKQQAPNRPDVIYQRILVECLQTHLLRAQQEYQFLTTLPSDVGIYVNISKKHLELVAHLIKVNEMSSGEQQAVLLTNAARNYWDMGYYRKAFSLVKDVLNRDSTYFTGLLWATHFAIQLQEMATAAKYLTILESIERMHPLVQTYKKIIGTTETLNIMQNDSDRTQAHLALALLYDSLQLPEEALDEAERALRYSPGNEKTLTFITSVLKKKQLQ